MSRRRDPLPPGVRSAEAALGLAALLPRPESASAPRGDLHACTLVALLDAFAVPAAAQEVRSRYRTGGIGYGDVKALLADQLAAALAPMRDRYQALLTDAARLDAALEAGERQANRRAAETLRLMSAAMGL